jgi:hypothetical protein
VQLHVGEGTADTIGHIGQRTVPVFEHRPVDALSLTQNARQAARLRGWWKPE